MNDNLLTTIFKKIIASFIGFAMGIIYGLILSLIAAKLFS